MSYKKYPLSCRKSLIISILRSFRFPFICLSLACRRASFVIAHRAAVTITRLYGVSYVCAHCFEAFQHFQTLIWMKWLGIADDGTAKAIKPNSKSIKIFFDLVSYYFLILSFCLFSPSRRQWNRQKRIIQLTKSNSFLRFISIIYDTQ